MNDAPDDSPKSPRDAPAAPPPALMPLAIRSAVGGVLMGLANLVPGISGGTMLLASGIYPRFITAIGEVTTLKFRRASLLTLAVVALAALLAIGTLAGVVAELVIHHRWVMYSLFIGLTLGGVPVVWRLIDRHTPAVWVGAAVGFVGMAALALVQMQGGGSTERDGFVFMLLAGVAGASAMILPGVSGGYLLLVLGVYVPILTGISAFKDALQTRDIDAMLSLGTGLVLPVGVGVVLGIAVVSIALKWLLAHHPRPTLGVLLGLLLGAVVGLMPFQESVKPVPGGTVGGHVLIQNIDEHFVRIKDAATNPPLIIKNQRVVLDKDGEPSFEQTGKPVEPDDWPTRFFQPSVFEALGAAGLILAGFGVTLLVDRLGREKPNNTPETPPTGPTH